MRWNSNVGISLIGVGTVVSIGAVAYPSYLTGEKYYRDEYWREHRGERFYKKYKQLEKYLESIDDETKNRVVSSYDLYFDENNQQKWTNKVYSYPIINSKMSRFLWNEKEEGEKRFRYSPFIYGVNDYNPPDGWVFNTNGIIPNSLIKVPDYLKDLNLEFIAWESKEYYVMNNERYYYTEGMYSSINYTFEGKHYTFPNTITWKYLGRENAVNKIIQKYVNGPKAWLGPDENGDYEY